MNLTPPTTVLVAAAIRNALTNHLSEGLTGVSCIAIGADSIFAEAILDVGGELEVILPASDYRDQKVRPENLEQFDALIRRASNVRVMPHTESNRDAYETANEAILSSCDILFAVWDGQSPADKGGTGAVIESARSRGVPVEVIWPEGAARA